MVLSYLTDCFECHIRRVLGQVVLWPNVQLGDILCVDNQTYHREIPAQLGTKGQEVPEAETVCIRPSLYMYMIVPGRASNLDLTFF